MTSSLSRQLSALQADSRVDAAHGAATRQSLLVGDAGSGSSSLALTGAQLRLLAQQGLANLAQSIPVLKNFGPVVFPPSQDDQGLWDDMEVDVEGLDTAALTLENFLVILSPHFLTKDAQFLLQYLMNQHQIHVKMSTTLLWACLPHLQSKLVHRIVQVMLETPSPWLKSFKQACHPATAIGLYRHLASDRGFFDMIANAFVDLAKKHVKAFGSHEGVVYEPLLKAFVQGVVGALELCHNVGEHHTRHLIRSICAAFKAGHEDFKAAAGVLFALLVPRVVLNNKSATKLLQVLSKQTDKSVETLGAVAILYRCQRKNLDIPAVADEFICHKDQVIKAVVNAHQMDDDDREFARRLMKALALLIEDLATSHNDDSHEARIGALSGMVLEGLNHGCQPDLDTVEVLISTATTNLVKWKQLKKSGKNMDDKAALKTTKKIVNTLRDSHPDAYIRRSALKPEQDILFMEGEEGGMPSEAEIEVKNMLLNDLKPFFGGVFVDWGDFRLLGYRDKVELGDDNQEKIHKLLTAVSPGFLLRQTEPEKLSNLIINTFHVYESNAKVQKALFTFINSPEVVADDALQEQFKAFGSLAALVTLNIVVPQETDLSVVAKGTKDFISAYQPRNDAWLELLKPLAVTLNVAQDLDSHVEYNTLMIDKMVSSVTLQSLCALMDTCGGEGSRLAHLPEVATFLAAFMIGSLKKPGKDWLALVKKLSAHLIFVAKSFKPEHLDNLDEGSGLSLVCAVARFSKRVSLQLFEMALASIKGLPYCDASHDDLDVIRMDLLTVAVLLEDTSDDDMLDIKRKDLSVTCHEVVCKDLSLGPESLELFLLKTLLSDNDIFDRHMCQLSKKKSKQQVSFKAKQYCALKYGEILRDKSDSIKRLLNPKTESSLMALLLAATVSPKVHKKVKKNVFSCLETAGTAQTGLFGLARHLADSKASILAARENTSAVMEAFNDKKSTSNLLALALQPQVQPYFDDIFSFVSHLTNKEDMITASKFGSGQIVELASRDSDEMDESDDVAFDEKVDALEIFTRHFLPGALLHCDDTDCWGFVQNCVRSGLSTASGKLLSALSLEIARANIAKIKFEEGVLDKWFQLVTDLSESQESEAMLAGRNFLDSLPCSVPADLFVSKLVTIWGTAVAESAAQVPARSTRISRRQPMNLMQCSVENWRKTFYVLETFLILEPKSFEGQEDNSPLLRPLNNLLKASLADEEGYNNAYGLELVLWSIRRVVDATGDDQLKTLEDINPELIVQCIRNSKNPDSKATALLILAKASAANAEYVLHNSIPIFTFMGSHFLKAEARSSFDVAVQAIDVIVPHIKAVCLKKAKSAEAGESECRIACLNVVRTFVDASTDMAPHRFKTFMSKLVQRLDQDQYLWIFTALYLKAEGKRRVQTPGNEIKTISVSTADKMQHLLDLYETFTAETQLRSVLELLERTRDDTKELRSFLQVPLDETKAVDTKGKPSKLSPKEQMDLVRVKVLHFVNGLFGSPVFGSALVTEMDHKEEGGKKKPVHKLLKALMEVSIVNIEQFEKKGVSEGSRLHRQFAGFSERILERSLSMLPASGFVKVMADLLTNELAIIRRKSLEVLNIKFQRHDDPVLEAKKVLNLLEPLVSLSTGKVPDPSHADESTGNQQLALLTLRSFTRALGSHHPLEFKTACEKLSKKSHLKELDNPTVTAATLLCLTDMFAAIGPHAVVSLQPFAQFLVDLMSRGHLAGSNPVLLSSIVYTVKTCMENFGGFLNPFYSKLVVSACKLSCIDQNEDNSQQKKSRERLRHLHSAISKGIPTHALLTILSECHSALASESHLCVLALSNILRDNVATLDKAAALSVTSPFLAYFLEAFKYRKQMAPKALLAEKDIILVEDELIETFMTLSLKLSLDDFKPMFYRLFSDATVTDDESSCEAVTTVFRVTAALANKLKSLFGFIAESLVAKSNTFLSKYSSDEFAKLKKSPSSADRVVRLARSVMGALTAIYTYNRVENLQIKNYEEHVNAILDYLECPVQEDEFVFGSLLDAIKECLGQLAASTDDETPWKYLNYQVLLYIRNNNLKVRLCVLEILEVFVEKKGEGYLSVLPDSVPLLAEALEDDDQRVEAKCKQVIKGMETVFGHSIDHYFE